MADDKNKIIVYKDWVDKFEALTDDEAGRLIKHFFRYINDLNPKAPDRITELSFIDIKNTLKRDLKKWQEVIDEKSKSGILGNLKRYYPDIYEKHKSGEISLEESQKLAHSRKNSHSDKKLAVNDSVNVNVNVNDSVINNPKNQDFSVDVKNQLCETSLILKDEKEKRKKVAPKKEKKTPDDYSDIVRKTTWECAKLFEEHLRPQKESEWVKWLDDVRKLIEIDKIPPELIIDIVSFARNDDFWSGNFHSLLKLRKTNPEGVKYIVVFNEKLKRNGKNKSNNNNNTGATDEEIARIFANEFGKNE